MVERWPHTVKLIKPVVVTQDADGIISESTPEEITMQCRIKPAGMFMNFTTGQNGDALQISYTISLPQIDDDYSGGKAEFNGKQFSIIKFENYQQRTKVWI